MIFLSFFLLPIASAYVFAARHKLPISDPEDVALGVGIHLTTSYAIAAVRYESGEVEDLVRVQGGAEYIELMSRWTNPENIRRCNTGWERFQCSLARATRQWNRRLGRPSTPDVAILASFLQEIKAEVENKLEVEVTDIFPVFPGLAAAEEEDIQDALDHVGLNWLFADRHSFHLTQETNAAFASFGYGLCKSWKDAAECAQEEGRMQYEQVLFLNFDNSSFGATLQYLSNVYLANIYKESFELDLGWWNLPVYEVPRTKFWAKIQEAIFHVGSALQYPPNKVILLGEHASDPEFVEVVKAALWENLEFDASLLLEANSGGNAWRSAARGAAELAGRSRYWSKSLQEVEVVEL